jgi:serine phosphatase RsbU (regulator of sigma subunit)/CHASE3 domain sensor protein
VLVAVYLASFGIMALVVLPPLLHVSSQLDRQRTVLAPAKDAAAGLASAAVDQETGERGFIITGQATFLAPYTNGRQTAAASLATLARSPIAAVRDAAAAAGRSLANWQDRAATPEIEARTKGNVTAAIKLVSNGTGRLLFSQLRSRLNTLTAVVNAQIEATRSSLRQATDLLIGAVIGSVIVALILSLATWRQVRRWLTVPIGELLDGLRLVGEGDFDHPIPVVGSSEIAEIGRSADEMRRQIVSELDEVTRARQALEQRGPVVLLMRSELEPTPVALPPGLEFSARFEPAEGLLAGDFYELIPTASGGLGFVVADVSGHGPEAGVMAIRLKYLVTAALQMGMGADEAMAWVAERLGSTGDMFATCLIALVEPGQQACHYASAGHPSLLVQQNGEGSRHGPTGPLLGPFRGSWRSETIPLDGSALVVGYTDGLIEARAGDGELFGADRLAEVVAAHEDDPTEQLAEAIVAAVRGFSPSPSADDLTLGVLRVRTEPGPPGGDRADEGGP